MTEGELKEIIVEQAKTIMDLNKKFEQAQQLEAFWFQEYQMIKDKTENSRKELMHEQGYLHCG